MIETEFNSNADQIRQIGVLFEEAHYFSRLSRSNSLNLSYLNKYYLTLRRIRVNIDAKTEKERADIEEMFKSLNKNKSLTITKRTPEGVKVQINKNEFILFYDKLEDIEMYLRRVATDKGLLLTDKKGFGQ